MYRNITYSNFSKKITLFTWNHKGERVKIEKPFKPYIYVEHPSGKDAISIYGTKLKKMEFDNDWLRKEYIKTCGLNRIFYNINPEQQFLIDNFYKTHEDKDFAKHPLRVFYIDIEVDTKKSAFNDNHIIKIRKKHN